jgi:hypothetical protein
MQDTFERFLPEFQKALQLGKFGAEIVGLPDIGLQQPGMIRAQEQGSVENLICGGGRDGVDPLD